MFLLSFFRVFLFFSFAAIVSSLIFFGFSFSKGDSEKKLADENTSVVVDEHDQFSEFVVENEAGQDVFVEFPEDFDEKKILPLSKDVRKKSESKINSQSKPKSQIKKRAKSAKKSFRAQRRAKSKRHLSSKAKLDKVSKLYYKRNYKDLIKLHFTKYELDMLFFKAMSYRALAFQNDASQSHSTKAKKLLNKIASKTKNKKLKEKSLLWMGITEWQFPTAGKSFLSRIYPLSYLQRKIKPSRASNDADLYIAFFHEQNNDYERAKNYYQKLMKSDPNDLVYDVNTKKFTNPREVAEHYLSALRGNLAQQNKKKSDLTKSAQVEKKEKKADKEKAAVLSKKVDEDSLAGKETKESKGDREDREDREDKKTKTASFEKEKDFDEIRKKLEAFKKSSPATMAKDIKKSQSPSSLQDHSSEKESGKMNRAEKKNQESSEEMTKDLEQEGQENNDPSPKVEAEKDEQFVEINSEKKDSSAVNEKEVEEEFFFE